VSVASPLLRQGIRDAMPLGMALVAIGMALGALARDAGLSWWLCVLASAVVYAGPAQFLAMSQLAAGAATGTIVVTTFVASLRYFLFAMSLAPLLAGAPRRRLPLLAHANADGSYALVMARASWRPGEARLDQYFLGTFVVSFATWMTGTVAGSLLGGNLPADLSYALGFASPAIFLAFLVPRLRSRPDWVVAAIAGFGAVGGAQLLPPGSETLVALVVAVIVGGTWTWRRQRRSS
jgi:4-azaleucine resistance transporter AzlC